MFEPLYQLLNHLLPQALAGASFLNRALVGGLFLAAACGIVGVGVLGHRMSFFTNAVSHSSFAGVAVGLLAGVSPYVGLVGFAVLVGLGITALRRRGRLSGDATVGVVFSAVMALGIALLSAFRGLGREMLTYIYGDILALTEGEVYLAFGALIVAVAFSAIFFNRLALTAVSPEVARASGVRVAFLEYAHAALVAGIVAVAIRAVGLLFVTALLILPAATARNVARNQGSLFWWSAGLGAIAAVGGTIVSVYLNTSTGATVILLGTVMFGASVPLRLARKARNP
ncbi:MAG: hypothetical protein A2Y64_04690 [Candidatus Coatesbacteria bacterium RBG_13_66_14]|uniref:ABC transporter n=1 Tax=Candidatus Coatesbacteria bacterium RBG_13_66_14 TaxID=1817816 RepID=A0A1F5EYM2_9BACT|nr:MAG: hypothetical protein A2Y64_04690 [Candidatus Coatesbacteria bacterium RBG_13_66_14]